MYKLQATWDDDFEAAFAALEQECTEVIRGLSVELWNRVLDQTPQFFGGAAASWTYSFGSPVFVDRSHMIEERQDVVFRNSREAGRGFSGLHKGHPDAIEIANFMNRGKEQGFRLGMDIFFANGVDHGEGPYAAALEDGSVHLRAVNQPGRMAGRAVDFAYARYGGDRSISWEKAQRLRTLAIGESDAGSDS
jgi:hypothetical protein